MALLKFKRSAVPAKVPSIADLDLGELAINTYDGKVYTKKDDGTQAIVEVGGGSGVTSFNTRTGAVTLSGSDVTTALGYTPANKAGDTFTGAIGVPSGFSGGKYDIAYAGNVNSRSWRILSDLNAFGDFAIQQSTTQTGSSYNSQLYISPSGSVTAPTDVRSPIFYDSGNTGYFLDPAGSSNLLSVQINGTLDVRDSNAQFWRSTNGAYQRVDTRTDATSFSRAHWYGVSSSGGTSNFRHAWYDNAAYFYVTAQDGEIIFNREAGETIVRSTGSFRAPIFYDSNDTSYYVDPNGNTVLNGLTVGGLAVLRTHGTINNSIDSDYGEGFVTFDPIPSGTPPIASPNLRTINVGNNYSRRTQVAFDYDTNRTWFRRRTGDWSVWSEYWHSNSPTISATSDVRAPIFYDSNNTAFYVDPASGSQLNIVSLNAGSKLHLVSLTDGNHYLRYAATGFSGAVIDGAQLAGHQGGELATNLGGDNWSLRWDASGNTFSRASSRAPVFYDSNNTAFYVDPATGSSFSGATFSDLITGRSSPSTDVNTANDTGSISIRGSTTTVAAMSFHRTGAYAMNMGLGTDNVFRIGGWSAQSNCLQVFGTGVVQALNDFRAPLFYDSNNTGYYLDPNNTSNLAGLTVGDRISGSVSGCTFTQDSQDQDNITLRTDSGFYQSSTGTNAEGWPLNDSGWQHMISCTHTNDSNYFAMQLAAGFFSTGLFYRSVNNNGAQAWSRVALYDNGYAAPLYASIFYDADNTAYYLDASSTGTSLNVAGSIVAAGNVTAYSDIRIKANVETIHDALDKLDQIRGVTYTRTDLEDKEQRYAGVIAQEIEAVLPEAVRDLGNIKAVDYNATIALLIQAVKELRDEVEALRK